MAGGRNDRAVVLWLVGAVALAVVLFGFFGPRQDKNDPTPSVENPEARGVRGAYLTLGELGYRVDRWDGPTVDLAKVTAGESTLVLLNPKLPVKSLKPAQEEIEQFLRGGGRVIATGPTGARLLPGGLVKGASRQFQSLCVTRPEGVGAMAAAGPVEISDTVQWGVSGPEYKVAQWCGTDAVVIEYKVGAGTAVWWSSAMPMTNGEIGQAGNLRLLLAALGGVEGKGRRIYFDEYLENTRESLGGLLHGLPWWSMGLQALAAGVLLVLSRGRRNGPVRVPVVVPRSSPVEFAESMGRLYGRAGATEAAVGAARARLVGLLREQCGVPRELVPSGVAAALGERLGGDWREVERHLEQAGVGLSARSALELVRALDGDCERIRETGLKRVVVER